jgi:drug/metabolite transporter (DMT)-like permease
MVASVNLNPVRISSPFQGVLVLVFVTMIWGSTFPLVQIAQQVLEPAQLIALRFSVAAFVFLPWMVKARGWVIWRDGALLGLFLFAAFVTQAIGITTVSPGRAAFITGLNVIFVPLMLPFLRRRVPVTAFIGAGLAFAGIGVMSWDTGALSLSLGDFWVLGCAITYAMYVLLLERYAIRHEALQLTAVQLLTVGILGLVWVAPSLARGFQFEKLDAPLLLIIVYLGVIAVSLTTWLQTIVQRVMPAFQTAVIYSLEPVFAAIFSWWWVGEGLKPQGFVGAALILLAMIVSQIPENRSVAQAANSSSD